DRGPPATRGSRATPRPRPARTAHRRADLRAGNRALPPRRDSKRRLHAVGRVDSRALRRAQLGEPVLVQAPAFEVELTQCGCYPYNTASFWGPQGSVETSARRLPLHQASRLVD